MPSTWYTIVMDCADPAAQGKFWGEVLGYQVVYSAPDEVVIAKDDHTYPGLVFVPVPEGKSAKNRLHIDLNPDEQQAEVKRLEGLGARQIDIGQGDVTWVVMADPEGNEFCVLRARDTSLSE
jgi:predicted enzyme related to lactoylglutathione lyase